MMNKIRFALWSLKARFDGSHNSCPYCKSCLHAKLQSKNFFMEARKCHYCGLIFRWPTMTDKEAFQYYQKEYESGIVTDLPSPTEVQTLKATEFKKSRFDKTFQLGWVEKYVKSPARIFNFGSSWGYTDYQLKLRGFDVEGFELSKPRAQFGESQFGLKIHSSWEEVYQKGQGRFDVIFTSHTLEHLTDLWSTLEHFEALSAPNAIWVIILPNAGGIEARQKGVKWSPYVGMEHTIAHTPKWFEENLKSHGAEVVTLTSSTPEGNYDDSCNGDGLIVIAKAKAIRPTTAYNVPNKDAVPLEVRYKPRSAEY